MVSFDLEWSEKFERKLSPDTKGRIEKRVRDLERLLLEASGFLRAIRNTNTESLKLLSSQTKEPFAHKFSIVPVHQFKLESPPTNRGVILGEELETKVFAIKTVINRGRDVVELTEDQNDYKDLSCGKEL